MGKGGEFLNYQHTKQQHFRDKHLSHYKEFNIYVSTDITQISSCIFNLTQKK